MHGVVAQLGTESSTSTTTSLISTSTLILAARAVVSASPTVTAVTIPVSKCCQSNTPPVNFGPSSAFTTVTTSSTPSVLPSETSPPPAAASSNGSVHPAVIAGTVIGAVVLLFVAAFLFFICRRRSPRTQRRNQKRRKTIRMYSYPGEYQTVPVNHPNSPPSHSPTPSSDSSSSSQGLLHVDISSYVNDQHENEYTYVPRDDITITTNNNNNNQPRHHIRNQSSTDNIFHLASSPRGDRRSVDTIFALRFYYTHELDRRSKGSFLAELPSSPILPPPVPPLPSSPPPPPPSSSAPSKPSSRTSRLSRSRKTSYLFPSGEPWKPLPPPAAPLPTVPPPSSPPPSSSPPQNTSHHRRSTNPTFSLFPKPPSSSAPQQRSSMKPAPLNISKNLNSSRISGTATPAPSRGNGGGGPRSAPLRMNPITNSVRGHIRGLGSAPLPCTPPKIVLQQAQAQAVPPTPRGFPKTPGSAPLPSTNNVNSNRFNSALLTPPIGSGEFAPPPHPQTTRGGRGAISMKGIEGGSRAKSLPSSPRRGFGWLERASGWGIRPRSPGGSSLNASSSRAVTPVV
ncbi:hypothetical protein QBC44DRAFT_390909 [Cladorrhinum sp. PSN332]|nr:hypothetical protein QBC44DRAFT_390909 [Cladorrhinum sp. PSN332]